LWCGGVITEFVRDTVEGRLFFGLGWLLKVNQLEMWANAQRDGRPAEYWWRPLFNAAKFG